MEKMAKFGLNTMNTGTFYLTLRQMEKDGDEYIFPTLHRSTR